MHGTLQLGVVEVRGSLYLGVRHGFTWVFAVEVEEDDGLEGADYNFLTTFGEAGFELAMG